MAFPSLRELWSNWSIQILVLFSLVLQVALFLLARIRRRRGAHCALRFLLWLVYQLSDFTVTFALGHLSINGAHPIVALWVPFLLLHLGGPDNITAYSLEDSKLWHRHLLSAILQVIGALYVLYESTAAELRNSSVLMLAVGTVKYVEKTRALMRSNLDTIRGSVRKQPPAIHGHIHPQDNVHDGNEELNEESMVRRAHSLFHICKRAIVDYPVIEDDWKGQDSIDTMVVGVDKDVRIWNLMENELSLMYDVLYTKAAVIHTWLGYTVRLASPLVIVASLMLFRLAAGKDARREEADVVITYVLYGGALFMETTSLLNALGSSWTFAFLSTTTCRWLRRAALCTKRWDRLRWLVLNLHHLVWIGGGSRYTSRRWSGTMGQFNMLHFCTRSQSALLGKLAKMVGLGLHEWWNTGNYSWDTKMTKDVKARISHHMENLYNEGEAINSLGMLRNRWGEEPLVRNGLFRGILKHSLGVEFQECIIIWHIGTDVFLAMIEWDDEASDDVKAIRMISNYMMFLLVEQPDMLPGLSQNKLYQRTCENLATAWQKNDMSVCAKLKNLFRLHDDPTSTSRVADREKLARTIYDTYKNRGFSKDSPRLPYVAKLAEELLRVEENEWADSLKLVLDVWTDLLFYASHKCSRKAPADKLSSGGELTTILWLMAEHFYQLQQDRLSEEENLKLQKMKRKSSS
jgi:hypothetical protein